MNLINKEVTHKVFGEGNIVDHNGAVITIDFNEDIKKFVYPDAFGKFITLNDRNVAKSLKKILLKREMEEEALERKRKEEKERQVLEQQRREKLKNHRIHESSQIVFWLDEEEQQNVFTDWQVFTGQVQSGKNKGQLNRAARLRPNSAGLLTARKSDQPETERQILGLYMVSETFSGDLSDDGIVPAHPEFRIELTDQEAEKMLFWNYYSNKNYPHRTTWNTGKYRYYDNVWTAQILKDIIALKTDEEEIKEAKNFLEYFCQMNVLDMDNIPEANGALKQ
ncbi:malate synthase [Siminovitchia acidinfaciens]|uniref:Malate synthase n=1 Tax=Siminovitchia acidinfaciens TaxID=2321395 RepID=A0A429Y7C9_9BACI|nr:malate synthase [Siminovitchia acidinfaciens]RST77302.1 malate synthase [Siminovitchia acidinfaciens]